MKLKSFEITPYLIELSSPFIISNKIYTHRSGFFVKASTESNFSYGEITILTEFGSEDATTASIVLKAMKEQLLSLSEFQNVESILTTLNNYKNCPAAISGVEQALLSLLCKETNTGLHDLLGVQGRSSISVNGLIGILSEAETIEAAQELIKHGYETIKLKVGRESIEDDIAIVRSLNKAMYGQVKLRLDFNSRLQIDEAAYFLNAVQDIDIEFIEQPVADVEDFAELKRGSGISLAADESLQNFEAAEHICKNHLADVLIIKPAIIGSIISSIKLISLAEANNIDCVVTTSMDTGIGKRKAVFAASLIKSELACGLTIQTDMNSDFYSDSYPVLQGKVQVNQDGI